MEHNKRTTRRNVDYQALATLLGINHKIREEQQDQPTWRRIEVLRELEELGSQVQDQW